MESGSVFLLIGCGHKPSAGDFLFWHDGVATLSPCSTTRTLSNQPCPPCRTSSSQSQSSRIALGFYFLVSSSAGTPLGSRPLLAGPTNHPVTNGCQHAQARSQALCLRPLQSKTSAVSSHPKQHGTVRPLLPHRCAMRDKRPRPSRTTAQAASHPRRHPAQCVEPRRPLLAWAASHVAGIAGHESC